MSDKSNGNGNGLRRGLHGEHQVPKRENIVLHIVGLTLAVCGVGIAVASVVEFIDEGPHGLTLAATGLVTALIGLAIWHLTLVPDRIALLDVFVTVTASWVAMAVAGAIPYLLTGSITRVDDAIFESVSGFTTTGATVLFDIEAVSNGVLFWRSITQWIGGMGVIVLVVAVLPTVGSGGMGLLAAEAPGPTGERLTPRVAHTARTLWGVYLGFTAVLAVVYMIAGMSIYDGVAHSLTTVSTGGFSRYSASMAHFQSPVIEWISVFAMFLAGTSFTLIYRALRGKVGVFWWSVEFRLYVTVTTLATAVVFITADPDARNLEGLRFAAFSVVSVVSTTGFANSDFGQWSQGAQAVLLTLMPLGAMAGSTAGGVKMVRILAVASFAHREALRQLHPRLVRPIRVGSQVLDDQVARKVAGFVILTLATFGGSSLLIALSGVDMITAFSAAATLMGNVGPGLAEVGPTEDFLNIPPFARWVGVVTMLLGRLEIYPILLALVVFRISPPRRLRTSRVWASLRQ